MPSKNPNSHFLDSSPSKELYNDDSEMISLLNNMWGSNYNNPKQHPSTSNTAKANDQVPNRRLTSSSLSVAHDHFNKQTPHKSLSTSRQSSIPTVPHHLNQQHDSHLIFLDSPNFDSFITFTPNQIQPSTKLFSNQKQYQHSHSHPHANNNSIGKDSSKSQLLTAQYLPAENFVSISPNLRTPLANKSNVEDLFDTPYLNTLYSTFANTTNTDELGNNNCQHLHSQSQHITEIAFVQTPLTEKLDKIFKTPTSNDIFNSKQFFGNSTIKRLTNTYIPSNSNSAVKVTPHSYILEEANNGAMNRHPNGRNNSNTDKTIETDFANFKNSPCVKHKQYELSQQEKIRLKRIDGNSNSTTNLLATVRESEESSKIISQDFFHPPMVAAPNTAMSTSNKMMHIIEPIVTPPSKSRKSKDNKKRTKSTINLPKHDSSNDMKENTSTGFEALAKTSTVSTNTSNTTMKTNVYNSINDENANIYENEGIIDSSPSTIVVSSASKSSTRLTVVPGNKILQASPTPMNKYINSVLTADNQRQSHLINIAHNKGTNNNSGNAKIGDNGKNNLHSQHNNILIPNHLCSINDDYYLHKSQENTTVGNMMPKAPVMGVFKEQSSKSLRKYQTQPLGLNGSGKSSFPMTGKKFGRSTSLNDSMNVGHLSANSNANVRNNNEKGKKRSRGNSGTIHFIMADPDQLKGNKKRRITRKKSETTRVSKSHLATKGGDKFVPLRNSTNIVNNRNKTPSPIKEKNANTNGTTGISSNADGNENNIFWEAG